MEKPENVTWEELSQMKIHHRKTEYSNQEATEVVNLVRKYVDQHQGSCVSCGNNLREAKTKLNTFYLMYKDSIEARLNQPVEVKNDLEVAKAEVENYKKQKGKK